ncbi:MAG: hypothetical protein VW840_20765, partial [Gammaproteobacteria bacterium]
MEHFRNAMAFSDPLTLNGADKRTPMQTIATVLPFLWPRDRRDMQVRVVIALGCLLLGRTANVYGPIVLKDLIDGLQNLAGTTATFSTSDALSGLLGLALLYGLMVLLPGALTEIRAAVFTPVSEYAQRVIGLKA